MILHNRVSAKLLRERTQAEDRPRYTLSFYRYMRIEDPAAFRNRFYKALHELEVLGRIYVASEGVNAQASVPQDRKEELVEYLYSHEPFRGMRLNWAVDHGDGKSFFKLIVRVRPKIVADGLDDESFDASRGGQHLDAKRFNELASRPDAVIVDMRNHYESEVGHFQGALLPQVDTFRESLPIVEELLEPHRKAPVLMYCTGGIRCEKASAWFRHRGFEEVYQLDGGIIEYARQVQEQGLENLFVGKNFVFDERLGERISPEIISRCHVCDEPSDRHVNCVNKYCHLLLIECDACAERYNNTCSEECKDFMSLTEEEQKRQVAEGRLFNGQRFPNAHYRKG